LATNNESCSVEGAQAFSLEVLTKRKLRRKIADQMKISLFALAAWCATTLVSGNGVPTPEMFKAETLEELQRLIRQGGSSINETMRDEVHAQRDLEQSQPLLANYFAGSPGFFHGVASGDPLPDAVILWTRYTPVSADDVIELELRMAEIDESLDINDLLDPEANPNLKRVLVEVTGESDWIAKLDVTGLPSGTKFVYAFSDGTAVSDIGQTKTAPAEDEDVAELQYAVFSCTNYGNGYFHAYDIASTIKDLDFWVHVGDYLVRIHGVLQLLMACCLH
jgi:hypothetical protein